MRPFHFIFYRRLRSTAHNCVVHISYLCNNYRCLIQSMFIRIANIFAIILSLFDKVVVFGCSFQNVNTSWERLYNLLKANIQTDAIKFNELFTQWARALMNHLLFLNYKKLALVWIENLIMMNAPQTQTHNQTIR